MIFAYIDPGAGSMLIQTVIAAALAVPFFLRERISAAIGRLRQRRTDQPTDQDG